jgi:S-formylglutathione hydrolase
MERVERIREFGGWLDRYRHASTSCHCDMSFSVFLPPQAVNNRVPAVYWLSGLTCTDDNFRVKAGAQRYAAEFGLALVVPDTSPRGADVPDVKDRYDLGQGAGFYVNATRAPWSTHYHMYDYVTRELPALVEAGLPLIAGVKSVTGHSMGGHGALICALKNPGKYESLSAFAPISSPTRCPWGEKAFSGYLGADREAWRAYDATLLAAGSDWRSEVLVDQGTGDDFLHQQLKPELLQEAFAAAGIPLTLRYQAGYDHSYYFMASFMAEHIAHHAKLLNA